MSDISFYGALKYILKHADEKVYRVVDLISRYINCGELDFEIQKDVKLRTCLNFFGIKFNYPLKCLEASAFTNDGILNIRIYYRKRKNIFIDPFIEKKDCNFFRITNLTNNKHMTFTSQDFDEIAPKLIVEIKDNKVKKKIKNKINEFLDEKIENHSEDYHEQHNTN